MPTPHRQRMIETGHAEPHHGHHKRAVKESNALADADQALLDEQAEWKKQGEKTAAAALKAKRAARAERHQAELEAKKFRKRPSAKK